MTKHQGDPARTATRWRLLALAAGAVLLVSCATTPASQGPSSASTGATPSGGAIASAPPLAASRGGTLRVVVPAGSGATGQDNSIALGEQPPLFLDPQLDGYGGGTFSGSPELARCCLVRTLLSYNGLSAEHGGARLQPDLAAALPTVSLDGLTWTFRIKPGLHYGPPLQAVEIKSRDFVRSLERLYSPALAQTTYYWLFADVVGAADYKAGRAAGISGLEAPDDHTLIIRLESPSGDFGAQMASPWAGPIPPDPSHPTARFGIAEGADTGYGRFLVSSGPYMLEGSEKLDFSVPVAQRSGASGLTAGRVVLVRNPSWGPATDLLRPAYADRIEITRTASTEAAVAALDAGKADLLWPPYGPSPSVPAAVFAAFQADPSRGQAHADASPLIRGAIMNLAVAPFDDIHVRKAVNLAIDKKRLVDVQGGPVAQAVLGHLAPDATEDGLLADYDPYGSTGQTGDLARARAEIAQSRYDGNRDGVCDASACQNVRAATRDPYTGVAAAVADDLKALGIDVKVETMEADAFIWGTADPKSKIPLAIGLAFNSGYISATGILASFDGRMGFGTIQGQEVGNTSMVGATADQLRRWDYTVTEVPNVDKRVEACLPLVGSAQTQCWAALDQYLMEYVVPWVPYSQDRYSALTSPRVLTYGFDELVGTTSLDQLALKP